MPYARGQARIQHADTGVIYTINAGELDWEEVHSEERGMGPETFYLAIIPHPELGDLQWELSEYPIGVENFQEANVGAHRLLENFEIGLNHLPDLEDEAPRSEDETVALIDEIRTWFFENYEDPAIRTPYESAEGGYQYIWGGPYTTAEVLEDAYPNIDDELRKRATEEIESEGNDTWVPIPSDDEYVQEPDEEPDEDYSEAGFAPPRQSSGPSFSFDETGRIALTLSGPVGEEELGTLRALLEQLRETSDALIASLEGTNSHAPILGATISYRAALDDDPISIDKVYALGLRLSNLDDALRGAAKRGELPELSYVPEGLLKTTLDLHATLIASTERGQSLLDSAKQFAQDERETEEDQTKRRELAAAVSRSENIFDENTKEIVSDLLALTGTGPNPARSTALARTVQRNLLATIATGAVAIGGSVFGAAFPASIPGSEAIAATTTVIDALWFFVTTNLPLLRDLAAAHGPDFGWVRHAFATIQVMLQPDQEE